MSVFDVYRAVYPQDEVKDTVAGALTPPYRRLHGFLRPFDVLTLCIPGFLELLHLGAALHDLAYFIGKVHGSLPVPLRCSKKSTPTIANPLSTGNVLLKNEKI